MLRQQKINWFALPCK